MYYKLLLILSLKTFFDSMEFQNFETKIVFFFVSSVCFFVLYGETFSCMYQRKSSFESHWNILLYVFKGNRSSNQDQNPYPWLGQVACRAVLRCATPGWHVGLARCLVALHPFSNIFDAFGVRSFGLQFGFGSWLVRGTVVLKSKRKLCKFKSASANMCVMIEVNNNRVFKPYFSANKNCKTRS